MTQKSDETGMRLSEEWDELLENGEAPELKGRSAAQDQRDRQRVHGKQLPTEKRRKRRRLSLTLSEDLIKTLRQICAECGYVAKDGQGQIASPVIELILDAAIKAYLEGRLKIELQTKQIIVEELGVEWTL